MAVDNKVVRSFDEAVRAALYKGWRKMISGRRISGNVVTLSGAPEGKVWVRESDGSYEATAVYGRVELPNVFVWVGPDPEGYDQIKGIAYAASVPKIGNMVHLATQVPIAGDVTTLKVMGLNFVPGRVRPYADSGSMLVYIEPFAHHEGRWPGGAIDLTSVIPATAGTCAWVAVALDPATDTLYSYAGTDSYDSPANLDEADAHAITIPGGYIPLAAVVVENGMTEVTAATRIVDLRPHFYMRGGLIRDLDDLANVDTTGKADGDALVWDAVAGEWVTSVPEIPSIDAIGDVDTSSTPPTDGQTLIWNDSTNLWVPGSSGGGGSGAAAFGVGVTKTLSSDVAAAGTDRHLILAAESGTVDDCIEITGLSNGDEVIVRADAGDTITLKHNAAGATDKILLYAGADLTLSGDKTLKLVKIASGKIVQYVDDKGLGGGADYILIRDEKSSGTNGGTFTSGAWRTRDLNTEISDAGNHASVSGNQITLAAGTYQARIICPAYGVNTNQARLYDITNSAVLLLGQNNYGTTGNGSTSLVVGKFTLAGSTVVEVQHRCSWTGNTNGYGVAGSWGTEVYTVAEFWKVG